MNQHTKRCLSWMLFSMAATPIFAVAQSNIDADNKWAWSENCGWTNWQHDAPELGDGVLVMETVLAGFVWGENIGWINLGDGSPADGIHYANKTGEDFGVNMAPDSGDLFGMAWGENVGWINFAGGAMAEPPQPARLDGCRFHGFVWGENIGWINLDGDEHFVQVEGIGCDDGNACTIDDTCLDGFCSGSPVDCSGAGDECNTASCDPAGVDGNCDIIVPVKDETPCDDDDTCTEDDQCTAGTCGGTQVDCSDLDDQCHLGVCSAETGECQAQPANEGGSCNDDDACTKNDICSSGTCSGSDITCNDENACTNDSCDSASGCVFMPNTDPCDDGDNCTTEDTCSGGTCVGGDPPDCDDGDVCTDDFCDPGDGCQNTPVDCSDLNDQCNVGVCHPASGECVTLPDNEGEPCDDDDLCTTGETCVDGTCGGGTVSDCSDLDDVCVIGVCNPATGDCEAQPVENGEACNDEEVCTENDACTDGVCGGVDVDCSELDDPCNVGVCHPTTGECVTLPANEGDDCDDGNLCTANEVCSAGECNGAPVECPEGESCDPKTGECAPDCGPCPTDVDGNGSIDAADLAQLLGQWGPVSPGNCLDSNGDNIINAADLAVLLGSWGPCQ